MKMNLESRSPFARRADMLVLVPPLPLLPARYSDNSMPERDWSQYDAPAWQRLGRPDPLRAPDVLPMFLRRQAG